MLEIGSLLKRCADSGDGPVMIQVSDKPRWAVPFPMRPDFLGGESSIHMGDDGTYMFDCFVEHLGDYIDKESYVPVETEQICKYQLTDTGEYVTEEELEGRSFKRIVVIYDIV